MRVVDTGAERMRLGISMGIFLFDGFVWIGTDTMNEEGTMGLTNPFGESGTQMIQKKAVRRLIFSSAR